MRINKFIAGATGMSRRRADTVILEGRVRINDTVAEAGSRVEPTDQVTLDTKPLKLAEQTTTIMLHKPAGYVVSRRGQGSWTVYDLLPTELHHLKPVGRLDKQSSGLLLLTDDGHLANQLTHPAQRKIKIYEVTLNKPLQPLHRQMISDIGITLDDGLSRLQLERRRDGDERDWRITMSEGRNRQIRRTFQSLGYEVLTLHRTHFGDYELGDLKTGRISKIN